MENNMIEKRRNDGGTEPEIVYSRSVKAGKRIYYLDVKKESKRKLIGENEAPQFEKHKVFLYKEDFAHFVEGLEDVISYVKANVGEIENRPEWVPETSDENAQEEDHKEDAPRKRLFGKLFKKD